MFDKVSTVNKTKAIYLISALVSFCLALLVKLLYRKIIYADHINDFGLADSLPSFLFTFGAISCTLFFIRQTNRIKTIIIPITSGALLYEFEQMFTTMVFDLKDVIALLLGACLGYYLYYTLELKSNTAISLIFKKNHLSSSKSNK